MRNLWYYLIFMVWISYILCTSLLLFVDGFFLNRIARIERSECTFCASDKNCDAREFFKNINTTSSICLRPRSRVVLLIVDALKYEFLDWRSEIDVEATYHLNKMTVVRDLMRSRRDNARLFRFMADPPTTTMQRLKALTTGTLPTFIDASANFAADSVDEDNLINQASKHGGVVFMGDDTWTMLFPGKFLRQFPSPSFDVSDLDTVDHQVQARIGSELRKKDWSLLIAHTLGVDHCGHKHGPNHPEMARKLDETNSLIGEIIDSMDNRTILFVIGDHGMTESGDHGGDSKNEIEAGMFVFTKTLLYADSTDGSSEMVNQIDLVPTISSLLGIPVPFSNIGTIVPACLLNNQSERNSWFVSHSVWRNVIQTKKYIDAYSNDTFLFNKDKLQKLNELYDKAEKEAKRLYETENFERFIGSSRMYLKSVRKLCAEIWIQFDSGLMSKGLIIFVSTLFFLYILLSTSDKTRTNVLMRKNFLLIVFVTNMSISLTIYVLNGLRFLDEFKNTNFFATGAISVLLLAMLVIKNWDTVSTTWYHDVRLKRINYIERVIFLLTLCGLFSNSYIIEEDKVVSFLLVTSVALLIYETIDEYNYFYSINSEMKWKSEKNPGNSRNLRLLLILAGFIACTAVRFSSYLWRCREEQNREGCTILAGKTGSTNHFGAERTLLIVSVIVLAIYVTIVTNWLRNCERISEFLPITNIARYFYGVIAVTIGCYWVFQRLPKDARVKIAIFKQINALPGIVYFFVLLGISAVYAIPLGVHLPSRRNDSMRAYRDGNDKARKLFDSIRELFYSKKSTDKPKSLAVFGSSTMYSSPFISLSVFVTLLWALLLGNVLAFGTFMMFITCTAVLGIVAMERFRSANNVAELLQVPSSAILCWFLIAEYFFYGTGHQPTFSTIHWDSAFIGTGGNYYGNFLPATLIGLNTYGCHLIVAITLPLLAIVPFTVHTMIPAIAKLKCRVDDDMRRGELVLLERDSTFHNALFSIYGKYILLHGIRIFGCMLSTTIHCRHLMVWKIFAPKLIFQGLSFLVSLGSVLASVFLVHRIDRQVDDLKSRGVMRTW